MTSTQRCNSMREKGIEPSCPTRAPDPKSIDPLPARTIENGGGAESPTVPGGAKRRRAAPRPVQKRVHAPTFKVLHSGPATGGVVYGLVDPRNPAVVRYVGQTTTPEARYGAHVTANMWDKSRRSTWLRSLLLGGTYPQMVLLERVRDAARLCEREAHWIAAMRRNGEADLNGTNIPHADRRREYAPL